MEGGLAWNQEYRAGSNPVTLTNFVSLGVCVSGRNGEAVTFILLGDTVVRIHLRPPIFDLGMYARGQSAQSVKLTPSGFVGSTPTVPTILLIVFWLLCIILAT